MMKKITSLTALLITFLGFSQEVLQDFENGGPRDPFGGAAFSLVQDPEAGPRGQVALLTASSIGLYYQGINIDLTKNVDLTSNKTMSMDVYSTSAITIAPKVVAGVSGALDSTTSATHTGSGWETLSFTFDKGYDTTVTANGEYAVLVIYYLWKADNSGFIDPAINRTFYVDNISGIAAAVDPCTNGVQDNGETGVDCGGPNCSACPSPPATAAPTPPERATSDVLSVFSGAYTDVTPSGLNIFAGAIWDNFTIESADDTRRLTTPNPGGGAQYEYIDVPPLNLTDFTHAHVDFYVEGPVAEGQLFQLFIKNFPNHPNGAGDTNLNFSFNVNSIGSGAWYSGDVELSTFAGNLTRDKIALVQVVAAGAPAFGPIYIDNIYFHKNTTLGIDDFDKTSFSAYPNPTKDSWTVKTKNERIASIQVYDILGKNVLSLSPNANETKIDASKLKSGLYFAKIATDNGSSSIKLIKN